jgi:hypothetical protein
VAAQQAAGCGCTAAAWRRHSRPCRPPYFWSGGPVRPAAANMPNQPLLVLCPTFVFVTDHAHD